MKNKNNDTLHLVLNSTEPAYTVYIKDITYVNESFNGPTALKIDVERSFVEEQSEGDMEKWHSVIEDVIYADLLEHFNEEVVDFTIEKIRTPMVTIGYRA
jgi:hypothetical protein